MDLQNFSSIVTAVLGVSVIVIGGMLALIYGTNRVLRDTADDLRNRVNDLEKNRSEDHSKISSLETERDVLSRLVTGEVHWVTLGEQLEHHHEEAQRWWASAEDVMRDIAKALTDSKARD